MIDMAEIGLELNKIKGISSEIKALDQRLTSGLFSELNEVLNRIERVVNEDNNIYGTVGRISRNANNVAAKLKASLNSLENFIDQQVAEYEKSDSAVYDRLSVVLERMAKLVGLNFKDLKIDSTSTVATHTVATTVTTGTSTATPVTPFVAAAGAGVMAMGGAKAAYSTPMYNQSQIATLRAQAEAKDAYNAETAPSTPTSRWYGNVSEPTLQGNMAEGLTPYGYVHGSKGEWVDTYINEQGAVTDRNGNILENFYNHPTYGPMAVNNMSDADAAKFGIDKNNYKASDYYDVNGNKEPNIPNRDSSESPFEDTEIDAGVGGTPNGSVVGASGGKLTPYGYVHGSKGEWVDTYINENGLVTDANGNVLENFYNHPTYGPMAINNMSDADAAKFGIDKSTYSASSFYANNNAPSAPAPTPTPVSPTVANPRAAGIGVAGSSLTMDEIVAGKVEVRNGMVFDSVGRQVGRVDPNGRIYDRNNGLIGSMNGGIIRDNNGRTMGMTGNNGRIIPTGQNVVRGNTGAGTTGTPGSSSALETTEVDANIGGKPSTQEPINTQTPSNTEIPVTPAAPTSTGGSAGRNNTPTGLGRLFNDDVSIRGNKFYDEGNKLLGTVNDNGIIVDSNGQAIGKATPGGTIIGVDGKQYGSIAPAKNGSTTGYPTQIPGFEGKNTSVFTDPGKANPKVDVPSKSIDQIPGLEGKDTSVFTDSGIPTVDPKPVASVPSATPTPAATRPRIIDPKNTSIPRVDHTPITKGADKYGDINKMFAKL